MRKAIAFILSCTLTAAAALQGIPARAAGAAETEISVQSVSGEFEYEVTDEETKSCQVTGYTGNETEIVIPETLDGYTVESIGRSAFSQGKMESISLPDTVTEIESYAFQSSDLKTVELPEGLESMGSDVFSQCTALTEAEFPSGMKEIPSSTFSGCRSLTSFCIPESVTEIGQNAFSGCSALAVLEIPDSVESIGMYAFYGCSSLTEFDYPMSWKTAGMYIFSGCSSLTEICVPEGVTELPASAFSSAGQLVNVVLPDTLETIGGSAFSRCEKLREIVLPQSLTSIGDSAFYDCISLTEIILPEALTEIASGLFSSCEALVNVTIPEGVTAVGSSAFSNCASLTVLELPDSVTSIGGSAFSGCSSLAEFDYPMNWKTAGRSIFYGCSSLTEIHVPEGVVEIPAYAFSSAGQLVNVVLPDTVRTIGERAFAESGLLSVHLPEGLETIGRSAFSNCTRLKSVTFPESLKTLEQGAFSGCASLESAELPSGLESWGYSVFEDCTGLLSVRVPGTAGTIPGSTFEGCTSLNQAEIAEGVTEIGEDAFFGCVGLKKIDLPDSIEWIGSSAFYNCSGLEEFRYPAGWRSTGGNIFQGCTSLKRIEIPEGVDRIPDSAFSYAELEEVVFPSTLTEIGKGSFRGNTSLTEIRLPDTVKVIDSSAFYGCTSLAAAELPEGLERIGQQAFRDCSGLSAVTVPASVEEAGELCFAYCDSLIIYCYSGTAMHQLCEEEGYDYRLLDDHEHSFTAETIQRPSCISGGTQELTCSVCGYHYRGQLEPLGHSWSEWRVESEATIFSDGRKVRECTRCGTEEEIITDRIEVDYTEDSGYGLAHFQVTDAVTLEPVPNAGIFVSTEEGEAELAADAEGKLDQVLPVGDVKLAVYADGYQIRNLSITVLPGQNKIPQIGISRNDLVQGKLTASEMTYEEMVEAGVDVNDPGNQHLYKYELVLEFTPNTELLSLAYYIDQEGDPRMIGGAKLTEGGEINLSDKMIEEESGERVGIRYTTDEGETVSVYPVSERFFLIIRGEVHWLKEMYDVELMVINTSMTDTVEDAEAELTLPEGLSLAAMSGEEQSLVQEIGTVGHGESRSVHWYVRGDAEGTYSIAAALRGTMQPFGDTFEYLYEAKDPIKVYAGSAMHLTYHVPDTAYYQEDYTVRIELENVSDKTLYNVSHRITDVQQLRVTTYSDGTVETEEYPVTGGTGEITVEEFRPGEIINIEVTTNIMFQSRLMEYQLANVVEYNPGIAGFLEAFRAFGREAETGDEMRKLAENVYAEAEALREDLSSAGVGKAELAGQIASGLQELLSLCGPEPSAAAAIMAGQMKTSGLWDELQAIAENPGSLKEYSGKELSALNSRIRAVQKAAQEDLRNPYAAIAAAIELMPMQFILTDSYVATVEESTTVIPSTIVVEPTGREYYSISSIPQYVMEVLEAYAGDALDAPRIAQFLGKTPAENPEETGEETVKIPEGGTKEYNVSATAGTGFKAWVEQPVARAGASEFKLSVNNDSAEAVDGVLHFTGSGILSVTAESGSGGVLCIEADDGTVKRCPIEVVEAHECGSEDWVTAAEPSGQESGLRVKYCDVCGEIIDMQEMELCDSHEFSPYYETESPDLTSSGVKKRVCVHCGCTQYVYTDAYALNGYVYAFPEGTSIREAEEFFGSRGIQTVFAEPGETQAATGTGFSSGGRNYQIVITGDVNGDAEVNMFDTFEITDHIKGEKTLTGASLEAGLADIYRSEPELFDLAEIVSQVTESTDQP